MKTKLTGALKCILPAFLIMACIQIGYASNPKNKTSKTLTFTDIENEFKFVKPLSDNSRQVILKKFGTIENYRDSIIARKNNPRYKNKHIIIHATEADSADLSLFNLSLDELQRKGIKVTIDPDLNNQLPVKSN